MDESIRHLWNRINLALKLNCLPSDIDKESNKDIETIMVILKAQFEKENREKEMANK